MAVCHIAPCIRSRITTKRIFKSRLGPTFKPGCSLTGKMNGRQFIRVEALGAERVFISYMFVVLARVITVELISSLRNNLSCGCRIIYVRIFVVYFGSPVYVAIS